MSAPPPASHWRGLLATAVILAVWVVLASRSPDLSYHFAPLLAAAAWGVAIRRGHARSRRDGLVAGVGGFALTAVVAVGLHLSDNLTGPTFWSDDGAIGEALLFAAVAAAFGARVASRRRPGLLGGLFGADDAGETKHHEPVG